MEKISARVAGICGILAPIVAWVFITISILINPWFRWADNALSDLGTVGRPYNFVYNSGLIIAGALFLVFLSGLSRQMTRKPSRIGIIFWYLCGISLILVGVFPDGDPFDIHVPVSLSFFVCGALAYGILGFDFLFERSERVFGVLMLSIIGLSVLVYLLLMTIPMEGVAIHEAVYAIAFSEFSIIFGARLLKLL